jgi:radical SAM protein with 4Fe4S-binding SPASM domain
MILLRNFKRSFNKALRQPLYAAGVLKKRLAAQMHYRLSDGRSGNPEAITFFLTHKCNLHCKMCGQWGEGGITKKAGGQYIQSELPLEDIKKLVDEASAFRPNITLFGGEPLLHSHAVDIIRYIKSKGMHCLVITNGYLLTQMAEDLVASGLDELNVSLDGGRVLHDEIRGVEGLFDRIMSGLKEVNRFKRLGNRKKPLINLQCTITKYNYLHLEQMLDVAEEAHADSLTFHNLIFTNKKLLEEQKLYDELLGASSKDWEGFDFEPGIDPKALYDKMQKILAGKYPFNVDLYPNFSQEELTRYYRDPCFMASSAPSDLTARCLSPWIVAYVFPDGEVRPCLNCTYSFGNIKDRPFRDIWNSEKAIRFRRELKKNKIFPLCRRCTELYRY